MALVATKYEHVTFLEKMVLTGRDKFYSSSLTGQVFTRTGLVRSADHAATWLQFSPADLYA